MAKKDNNIEIEDNPLAGFSLLKTGFEINPGAQPIKVEDLIDDKSEEEIIEDIRTEDKIEKDKIKEIKTKTTKESEISINNKTDEDSEQDEKIEEESKEEIIEEEEGNFIGIIKHFAEKGILDEVDEIEDSEEGFESAIENTIKSRAKSEVEKELSILGEDGKLFLDFVKQGGDPKQFMQVYYNPVTWEQFNIESVDAQKYTIRQALSLEEEYTSEEVEEIITEWEDMGSLEKHSKKHLTKLQKVEKQNKEYIVKSQEEASKSKEKQIKDYWDNFKSNLDSKEEIKGFKVTKKEKDELWNLLTIVDKRTGKTEYEKALASEPDAALLFAYLVKNKFDISKLEKQVKTKVVSTLSAKLKNIKTSDSRDKIKSGQSEDFSEDRKSDAFGSAFRGLTI